MTAMFTQNNFIGIAPIFSPAERYDEVMTSCFA